MTDRLRVETTAERLTAAQVFRQCRRLQIRHYRPNWLIFMFTFINYTVILKRTALRPTDLGLTSALNNVTAACSYCKFFRHMHQQELKNRDRKHDWHRICLRKLAQAVSTLKHENFKTPSVDLASLNRPIQSQTQD